MDLFVYSDESGVFDYVHNDYYVFGGLLFIGKDKKDDAARKYIAAEKAIASSGIYDEGCELKASRITNKDKGKLYRSLNQYYKFAVVVKQQKILKSIFSNKKSKQRYLDYAYKIGLKQLLMFLLSENILTDGDVGTIRVYVDEHTTATNGRYELREAMLQEYKYGTYNYSWNRFYNPILPRLTGLEVKYCDSATTTLIRAADVVANRVYYCAINGTLDDIRKDNFIITELPI